MEINPEFSFYSLPKEIKQLIFSYFYDVKEIIRIQATSSQFQSLIWRSLTSVDFSSAAICSTSYGWGKHYAVHDVELMSTILKRLDQSIVTELTLRAIFPSVEGNTEFLAELLPKLRKLSFEYSEQIGFSANDILSMKQLTELRATRLVPDTWDEQRAHNQSFFEQIPSHVRIMHFAPIGPEELHRPNYNTFATDYVSLSKEQVIRLPKTMQAVCGLSFSDKIVVGCEDGSIIVYRYDKDSNSMAELSTRTGMHLGRINQITQVEEKIIFAASEGVLVSYLSETELLPSMLVPFTEPIYMVQFLDTTKNTFLAAGKRTVYMYINGDRVKQRSFDSDITGLYYSPSYGYEVATRYKYYHGPGTLQLQEIDKLVCNEVLTIQETPNMSISPDGSLRVTATKGEMGLYDVAQNSKLYSVPGLFAEGPNLQAYCPIDYWITASTGHAIWTMDLQVKQVIKKFAPEISEADMRQGNFPTVRALWYEVQSAAFFALFSDNTLRWWKISFGPKSYIGEEERKRREESAQTPATDPTDDAADPTHGAT